MKRLVLGIVVAAGCTPGYDPDIGPPFAVEPDGGSTDGGNPVAGCNVDSDPFVAVSFATDVRPLMTRAPGGCAPCHIGRVTAGLDLSSYQGLRRGGINSGTRIVIPDEPCNSILVQKISRTPPFGSRMPFNGPPYFTVEEQQIIRDWIAEGAANN